jgi:hypothetical protein
MKVKNEVPVHSRFLHRCDARLRDPDTVILLIS